MMLSSLFIYNFSENKTEVLNEQKSSQADWLVHTAHTLFRWTGPSALTQQIEHSLFHEIKWELD